MHTKTGIKMSVNLLPIHNPSNNSPLNETYKTPESKARTVSILGSSRTTDALLDSMDLCSRVTKGLINNGYNILSGCGSNGIMGAAYRSASENSIKDISGRPIKNLAIVKEPAWGDEDLEHCVLIDKAPSEADRIEKFVKTSDSFIIFPGGETTMQETTSLIAQNKYPKDGDTYKKIILVGKEFFAGLIQQYKTGIQYGTITTPFEKLFKVLDSETDILKEFPKLNRLI